MKKTVINLAIFAAGLIGGIVVNNSLAVEASEPVDNSFYNVNGLIELIDAYEEYYVAVECALDTLNNEYEWVDSYDFEKYYEARERVDEFYDI